jgi:hypothetical protein
MVNNTSKIEKMEFISKHVYKLPPNNSPLKPLHWNLSLKAMISIVR